MDVALAGVTVAQRVLWHQGGACRHALSLFEHDDDGHFSWLLHFQMRYVRMNRCDQPLLLLKTLPERALLQGRLTAEEKDQALKERLFRYSQKNERVGSMGNCQLLLVVPCVCLDGRHQSWQGFLSTVHV